ncbi:hypothetical protein KKC83_01730 [Patescibacteria group bacterium]|nr:hypothetical protein [Candidatus Falkowbacteria bacterium]MBU3905561.1 hypothetical protein [Patescibacteria group bacterium]MBU4015674.1 hypothetical protein [Patescibacteria group bacterium]MBU4026246.1 hypothetical protein [Patescibacteria group bacterium]MBU4073097.1 hypothetical protein [Patescibacteria group bacterium]
MERNWSIIKIISKKLKFLFAYLLVITIFFSFFFSADTPLSLMHWIKGSDVIVCIAGMLLLLLFSIAMIEIAKERIADYDLINRLNNRKFNRVLTGDRIVWRLMG